MGTKLRLLFLLLFPTFLFSQSEGGFGYRRFSNTTTMNNVAPSNINTSHSRNAYVHSNGLYYTWDGNSWELEEAIDTLSLSGTTISISLYGDGVPAYTLDISTATGFGVNIFNSDGTQDDADRLFTQDSTRTFAMGQFTSVSTPTWGRGYYYDPSTANGIRILNKNGSNTTTAMVELDPETINIQTTHTTSSALSTQVSLSQIAEHTVTTSRTSSTYGVLTRTSITNANEEIIALTQAGNGTIPTVSMYLGDGYASSSYAKYVDRAWGVQTHIASGSFDWLQILLPDSATDTTGNNINFYNRKYFWSNEQPSITLADTSVHVWIGNGTNTTPDFINLADFVNSYSVNIGNSDLSTDDDLRTLTLQDDFQIVGDDADASTYIEMGSLGGGRLLTNTVKSQVYYSDVTGTNQITARSRGLYLGTMTAATRSMEFATDTVILSAPAGTIQQWMVSDDFLRVNVDSTKNVNIGRFYTNITSMTDHPGAFSGTYGFAIEGSGGFGVTAKRAAMYGTDFAKTSSSKIIASGSGVEMYAYGGSTTNNNAAFQMVASQTILSNNRDNQDFNGLGIGIKKSNNSGPNTYRDYVYITHGGGTDVGVDTVGLSFFLGFPQTGDSTTSSDNAFFIGRGAGIQSVIDKNLLTGNKAFNWFLVEPGISAADTADTGHGSGISFYEKYYWSNTAPSSTLGDTTSHVWIGDGTNPQPAMIDLPAMIQSYVSGAADGNGIYSGDGDLPTGGSEVTMDAIGETLRFNMGTGNTTTREMIRMHTEEDAFTRYFVLTSPEDSARLFRAGNGREYTLQTYGGTTLTMASDSIVKLVGDSLLVTEDIVPIKNTMRFLLGLTDQYYAKRVDGNDQEAGTVMVSNATDWVPKTIASQEVNNPAVLRPSQLTANQNDWNPTGFSTTKTQRIKVSGDGSFRFITGMVAATRDGVEKIIENNGTANTIGIAKLHTGSSSGNRFNIPKDVLLFPGMSATFSYDSVAAAWRLKATSKDDVTFNALTETSLKNGFSTTGGDYPDFAWTANGGAFSGSSATGTTFRNRYFQFSTSTAAMAWPTLSTKVREIYIDSDFSYHRMAGRVRIEDLATGADAFEVRFGYKTTLDTNIVEGAYINYNYTENSGGWTLKTHDGSTLTTTNAGAAVAADTWYNLELIYYPYGEVTAFINGTRYTTTSTLPEAIAANPFLQLDKDEGSTGTTARLMYVTAFDTFGCNVSE